jgi:hypothetical protein
MQAACCLGRGEVNGKYGAMMIGKRITQPVFTAADKIDRRPRFSQGRGHKLAKTAATTGDQRGLACHVK